MDESLRMRCDEDCRTAGFGKTERPVGWEGNGEPIMMKLVRHCEGKPAATDRLHLQSLSHSFTLDFTVFCESREEAEKVVIILTEWLKERGLVLSPEKTRIVHLSEGFDFLGFNIRQFKTRTRKSGWKLLIRPSKESVKKIREKLRIKWRALRGREVSIVLKELNPIIRGWANYFRIGVSYRTFSALDHWMVHKAIRYAKRTHPTKPKRWWQAKYFGQLNLKRKDRWVFGDKRTGAYLLMFKWHKIERHILVKGNASPDNPELREYWERRRMMKIKDLTPSRQKVAKTQNGVCPICGDWLFNEEELQVHHKKPKSEGGGNRYDNLALIHLYCHQQAHSN